MKKHVFYIACSLLLLGACTTDRYPSSVEGYAPIYISLENKYNISASDAAPYENPGKIYKYGSYSFQMDQGKGIHVINSSDPANPQKIKFIRVPGCSEISIKNNMLFTNNFEDLVTLSIADLNNVTVTARNKGVFPISLQGTPPESGVYIECTDPAKGVVVGWEKKILENPKCFIQ